MPLWTKATLSPIVTIIHKRRSREIINAGDLRREKSSMSSRRYFFVDIGAQMEIVLCGYWND